MGNSKVSEKTLSYKIGYFSGKIVKLLIFIIFITLVFRFL